MQERNEAESTKAENNYKVIIGQRLREECEKMGLTQQKLAEKIGVDPQTVARWELGKHFPDPEFRRELCELFQKSMEELFGEYLEFQRRRRNDRRVNPFLLSDLQPLIEESEQCTSPEFRSVFIFQAPLPGASEFFGRTQVRMLLHSRLSQKASTSLVGPRKIGKTWLLQYLQFVKLPGNYRIGYIDATEASCQSMDGLVDSTLEVLKIAPVTHIAAPVPRLERAMKQGQKKVAYVLCIDEFEGICTLPDLDKRLFLGLRALTQQGYLCMVTASRQPLPVLLGETLASTSPFFNIFQRPELGPFDREEAEFFARKKGSQAGFTPWDQVALLEHTRAEGEEEAWYPVRLQLAGQQIELDQCSSKYRPDDPDYWRKFKEFLDTNI